MAGEVGVSPILKLSYNEDSIMMSVAPRDVSRQKEKLAFSLILLICNSNNPSG